MENKNTNALIEEIAEIVRRVGKRTEIEDEIIENVSFSNTVTELINQPGPVRDTAVKAITNYIKTLEIESDSDTAEEILDAIEKELKPKGVILIMKARHLCKEMRGVKKNNGEMTTLDARGIFKKNYEKRKEFMDMLFLK